MNASSLARFLGKVKVSPDGCWLWTGARYANGYGLVSVSRRVNRRAHRVSFEHFVGPIPDGLQMDHLCLVRLCVNPDHLEAVTAAENNRRMQLVHGIGRYATHCKRGHEFTPDNTYRRARSMHRICRACDAERQRIARSQVRRPDVASPSATSDGRGEGSAARLPSPPFLGGAA